MLTGDARAVAQWVARELALDDVFAEVLPHEKAEKIREVKARGLRRRVGIPAEMIMKRRVVRRGENP